MNQVVYFSLNLKRRRSFYSYVRKKGICYCPNYSFGMAAEKTRFNDPRDLLMLIEQCDDKMSLHVIIDYISCCKDDKKMENYATVIRNIIMCYPEVQFLFDETFARSRSKELRFNFMNFLFMDGLIQNGNVGNTQVLPSFHTFCMGLGNTMDEIDKKDHEQFILLLKGRNNTYDASNLRRAIKQHKFDELHVKDNFSKLNESRRDHAAVVVEEEYHQNMFNSYCLYANGFRVFPVVTASELLWLNQKNKDLCNESLVVRDYDLQFVDERENSTPCPEGKDDWEEIDWIRGAKKSRDEKKYSLSVSEENGEEQSPYWKAFASDHVYFVSKGDDSIRMRLKNGKRRKHMRLCRKNKILKLNGMRKPLEGIFVSIQNIKEVKERFQETRYRYGETTYKIVIKRKDKGGHSCPLDIYGIARSMVHRAEVYSQKGRYRMAALVAGEALGILNGFHVSLMKTAYFIQAVAENAMAVRLLGGDENVLSQDVVFRMRMVKDDVARMVPVRKDQQNVLYNIFNDCRLFCREKEYFDAADHALSIMMQEKEGIGVNTHPRRGLMRCWLWLKEMVNNKNEQGE